MAGYIGNAPINNSIFKQVFTPSTGTTTFTPGTAYTPGFIDVYQNGVKLIDTTDYTASNGTTVVLGVAATTGDTVEIVIYETFQSAAPSAYTGNFSVSGTGTVSGAFRHGVLAKSADYTVLSTDPNVCLVTTAGSNRTMTLPAASAVPGQIIRFIKVDDGAGKLIMARAGSDTMGVNGTTTMELWYKDNYVDLMSDGSSRWIVVGTEVFMVPVAKRGVEYIVGLAGTTTLTTWTSVSLANYVPVGTQFSYYVDIIMSQTTNTSVSILFRPHGSSDDDFQQTFAQYVEDEDTNVHDGSWSSHGFTEVGYNSGVPTIEYYLGGAGVVYYQAQRGYRLG